MEIRNITPKKAEKFLMENDEAVLVDVRTSREWSSIGVPDTSKFAGSCRFVSWVFLPIPRKNPNFMAEATDGLEADTPVVLLCRSGGRSMAAAQALVDAGYTEIYNVIGGFEGGDGEAGWKYDCDTTTYKQ